MSEVDDGTSMWTPLESITITKALDEDSNVCLMYHTSDGLNPWEAVGMLTYTLDAMRAHLQSVDDEDED
jgi:hypothetical protein